MSDNDWYEDGEDNSGGTGNLVNDLRNQLKEKSKAEKELTNKLAQLEGQFRVQNVGAVLKTAGVNEKVAKLVPSDIEPTAEAVGKWLEEYKDVFGITVDATPNEVDPEVVAQMTAMNTVATTGQAPGGPSNVTMNDIQGATTLEDLEALIAKAGGAL